MIILPECRIDEALPVLERVRQRIAQRLTSGGLPTFTVSFGVASSEQAQHFEEVVSLADQALLQAKAAGRDQAVVATDAHRIREAEAVDGQDVQMPDVSDRFLSDIPALAQTGAP